MSIGTPRCRHLALALAACLGAALAAEPPIKGDIRHAFILADNGRGRILRYSTEGKLVWECHAPNAYDVQVLPNGNVLFAFRIKGRDHGVREVTPEKKVVWEYRTTGEVFACERLPNGNTLVGECTNTRLVEVDPEGKVAREIKVKAKRAGHGAMRLVRSTKQGTYLVGHPADRAVREYNAAGDVVREIKTPGTAYGATRLENGNTLISCEHVVLEVDKNDKVVWSVTDKEIPEVGAKWMTTAIRLPNGNTVICNWLGHRQEGKGRPLFEVTKDKKVVWQFTDVATTRHVSSFRILDANLEAEPTK